MVSPRLPLALTPHYVGIDENGVGPRLGPMIVTSVVLRVDGDSGAKLVTGKPTGSSARRIGDSKKLVAFDDSALGEAWARVITRRSGADARTPAELLAAIALDAPEVLQAPCPKHHTSLCWNADGESFRATDDAVAECEKDLIRLEKKGVHVLRARSAYVCTRQLNEAAANGVSRFDLDLHAMERLTMAANEDVGGEVHAICGKVGGFDFYGRRFGPLAGRLHTVLVEGRARSEYQFPGVGRLSFVRDADGTHLLVGLASLVGKWVRDHLMRRVVRFHRDHQPALQNVSGYHDPVTTTFIEATALLRKKLRVEDACFERRSVLTSSRKPPATKHSFGSTKRGSQPELPTRES